MLTQAKYTLNGSYHKLPCRASPLCLWGEVIKYLENLAAFRMESPRSLFSPYEMGLMKDPENKVAWGILGLSSFVSGYGNDCP